MPLRQTIAKKIILATDPHAFDEDSLLAEIEKNNQRIANDPEIQERRRIAHEKSEREHAPLFIAGCIVALSMWSALVYFFPNIIKLPAATLGFAVTNGIWCAMNNEFASHKLISWASGASGAAVLLVLLYLLRSI